MAKIYDIKQFNVDDFLGKVVYGSVKEEEYKTMTDEELLQIMRTSPEFANFAFPNSWYGKFDLPNKECRNMKEFLKESPWMKKSYALYTGKIEDVPAKPGGNRPLLESEPVKVEVLAGVNMFSDAPTNQTASLSEKDSEQNSESHPITDEPTKTLRL